MLLDKGADINAKNEADLTPLMAAAREGRIDIAKLLLDNGADINAKNEADLTPLMAAAREQLDLVHVPKSFKGAPITLVLAGLMALAFMGFAGMVSIQ